MSENPAVGSQMPVMGGGRREVVDCDRPCPLCGEVDAETLMSAGRRFGPELVYQVVACNRCSLRFVRPLPTEEELVTLYGDDYYGEQEPAILSWDRLRLALHSTVLWHRRQTLRWRSPGRLLDVGCGDGDFLAALEKRGWEVHGCEFSRTAAGLARSKGIEVHQGPLSSAGYPAGFFDVVTLWHVLEHLPEPARDLTVVHRLLKDDGLLVIEVPDSASPTFHLCGRSWFPLDVPRHLQHFTPTTLDAMLDRAGLRVQRRQRFHPFDFILAAVSFVDRLGLLGERQGAHYFVDDFRRASLMNKGLFLLAGFPLLLAAVPYSLIATGLGGHGETVRLVAQKA